MSPACVAALIYWPMVASFAASAVAILLAWDLRQARKENARLREANSHLTTAIYADNLKVFLEATGNG